MPTAKITSKGQITVPAEVRAALDLGKGDSLVMEIRGDYAVLRKAERLSDVVDRVAREYPSSEPDVAFHDGIAAHVRRRWSTPTGSLRVVRPAGGGQH